MGLLLGAIGVLCVYTVVKVLDVLWWRPKRLEELFATQGIKGPPYRFFVGCVKEMVELMVEASKKPMMPQTSHNILPRVLSFYHHWKKMYGSTFVIWFGPTPRLAISDPDLIREIFVSRSDHFDRYEAHPMLLIPFIGKTVVDMAEKLSEDMSPSGEVEIDVSEWFHVVAEDAITRAAFGRSYDDGKAVFRLQNQLMGFASEAFRKVFIPGYRFLPTKRNKICWRLDREIRKNLVKLINRRRDDFDVAEKQNLREGDGTKDLIGLMIDAGGNTGGCVAPPPLARPITVHDIVEECKTFFFAGKQTTSNLLTWTTVLLAMHPEWQERARAEVLRVCGSRDVPTPDQLPKLKTLGMILNETLRLYPPVVATIRRAKSEVELGGRVIPRGTEILIPIMAVHHDPLLWGPDVARFEPGRFESGSARAGRHPMAFLPFGLGARTCIGQNLALLEAKLAAAILLQRFSLRASPNYVHAPTVLMLLYPQHGAPVIFRALS
ncbi:Cytochrome P450 734A6 [Ananas comosus]|uniref:Cytochrome P450 734A6 n=1 Tax=Ananas comosus TaxID=4615 RepID=A0A199W1Z7_ANACO|nr:Cytochrome P450 734A6 [Ananas comosus]